MSGQDDSSPHPSKRIKLDSPTPPRDTETKPASRSIANTEDHCSICLQHVLDRTVVPICAHEFCFECILVWSEQSRRCPLCSQPLGGHLIHNIRSKYDYQKHYLAPMPTSPRIANASASARVAHARTRTEQELGRRRQEREEADRLDRAIEKRRWVYQRHLYAKHVSSNTYTRYRPCPTPAQFAASKEYISRMTMFLRRELRVWVNLDVEFLTTFILSLMKSIDIRSESAVKLLAEFLDMDNEYVDGAPHVNAEHFAHEIYSYLRSPYKDLFVYDTVVQYDTPSDVPPAPEHQDEPRTRWRVDSRSPSPPRSSQKHTDSVPRRHTRRSRSRSISWSPSGRRFERVGDGWEVGDSNRGNNGNGGRNQDRDRDKDRGEGPSGRSTADRRQSHPTRDESAKHKSYRVSRSRQRERANSRERERGSRQRQSRRRERRRSSLSPRGRNRHSGGGRPSGEVVPAPGGKEPSHGGVSDVRENLSPVDIKGKRKAGDDHPNEDCHGAISIHNDNHIDRVESQPSSTHEHGQAQEIAVDRETGKPGAGDSTSTSNSIGRRTDKRERPRSRAPRHRNLLASVQAHLAPTSHTRVIDPNTDKPYEVPRSAPSSRVQSLPPHPSLVPSNQRESARRDRLSDPDPNNCGGGSVEEGDPQQRQHDPGLTVQSSPGAPPSPPPPPPSTSSIPLPPPLNGKHKATCVLPGLSARTITARERLEKLKGQQEHVDGDQCQASARNGSSETTTASLESSTSGPKRRSGGADLRTRLLDRLEGEKKRCFVLESPTGSGATTSPSDQQEPPGHAKRLGSGMDGNEGGGGGICSDKVMPALTKSSVPCCAGIGEVGGGDGATGGGGGGGGGDTDSGSFAQIREAELRLRAQLRVRLAAAKNEVRHVRVNEGG